MAAGEVFCVIGGSGCGKSTLLRVVTGLLPPLAGAVRIDGEEMIITGAGATEIRLKPGQYKVLASRDGKVVRQELVTITKNGRQVVRISREAAEPAAAAGGTGKVPEAMPEADAVRQELRRRNPDFKGVVAYDIEEGRIVGCKIVGGAFAQRGALQLEPDFRDDRMGRRRLRGEHGSFRLGRGGGVIGRRHKGGVGRLFRCGGSRRGDIGLIGGIAARVGQRSSGGRRGRLGIASGRRFDPNVLPYFQAGGIGQLVIVARRGSGRADCGERMRLRPRLIGRGQQNGQCD